MTTINREAQLRAYGITLLRVVLGIIFVAHGAQKLFQFGLGGTAAAFGQMGVPFPGVSAALVTASELGGGAFLLMGLFTRLAAVPLAVTMTVAIVTVHLPNGFFMPQGVEFPLALLAGNVALMLTGPGALALGSLLGRLGESTDRLEPPREPREELRAAA